jgi:hypothetical protein
VTENDPLILREMLARSEHPTPKAGRLAWVSLDWPLGVLVEHFGGEHDGSVCVEQRDLVGDRGEVPMLERHETPGANRDLLARGQRPHDLAVECSLSHVQAALES